MAQLVGRNCVHCGERIADVLEGRFCVRCGSPIHNPCAKSMVGGCPECGAAINTPESKPIPVAGPAATTRTSRDARHTRLFLIVFYILAVVWGASVRSGVSSGVERLVSVAGAIALGWWSVADANRRRSPIPRFSRPWFFLLAGLVVPVYVIWSRGWRGAGWVVLNALLWLVLGNAVMYLGWFIFG
jgi:hypothetical protein